MPNPVAGSGVNRSDKWWKHVLDLAATICSDACATSRPLAAKFEISKDKSGKFRFSPESSQR
jgi:hypothetical protein